MFDKIKGFINAKDESEDIARATRTIKYECDRLNQSIKNAQEEIETIATTALVNYIEKLQKEFEVFGEYFAIASEKEEKITWRGKDHETQMMCVVDDVQVEEKTADDGRFS